MAVVRAGQTWDLSGSDHLHNSRRKSVVLVKLTDASIRALEDFVNRQSIFPSGSKPTIRFQQDTGRISVPVGKEGQNAEFSFSLSSLDDQQGPNGSFECLSTKKQGLLESIGVLQEKLHVKASDDSYTRFGEKMVEAKKESEKRTTQFLDRRPSGARATLMRKLPSIRPNYPKESAISSSAKSSMASRGAGVAASSNFLPGTHPMLDRSSKSSSSSHIPYPKQINSDLMRRPLKERIIHLLAVRPYKKPELLSRISRDGILEKDKRNITLILKQVSAMKDNTYHLLRHIWNDVSEDWPFYSEQERQAFRRRKPQNLTPPFSDGSTSSSGHSPSSTHPASPPPPVSNKRNAYYAGSSLDDSSGIAAKKKRVSNYIRPSEMRYGGYGDSVDNRRLLGVGGNNKACSPFGKSPAQSPARSPANGMLMAQQKERREKSVISEANNRSSYNNWLSPSSEQHQQQQQQKQHPNNHHQSYSKPQQNQSRHKDQEFFTRNIVKEFPSITNRNQRALYKKQFSDQYGHYKRVYDAVRTVSERFEKLESDINKLDPYSESWKKLRHKIFKEHHDKKPEHDKRKRELEYLHEKLAHIKKMVSDFDMKNAKQ